MAPPPTAFLEAFTGCAGCGRPQERLAGWRCAHCGGVFRLKGLTFDCSAVRPERNDLSRYASFLPLRPGADVLGAGWTPVSLSTLFGREVYVKEDFRNPTGSFKDRGMAVLANLASAGERVFVDSVGNTSASLAAFARALGLEAHVFAPLATSRERAELVTGLGARLHRVAGPRAVSNEAAIAASGDALYLSHIHQPLFQAGTATCAFELAEQVRPLPDRIFVATGQGTLFLGLWYGFQALQRAGVIERGPPLIGVRPGTPGKTVAVGAGAVDPVRAREYREAARASGGEILWMTEDDVYDADTELSARGWNVDPAASLAVAGWRRLLARDAAPSRDVIVLCGAKREALPPRPTPAVSGRN